MTLEIELGENQVLCKLVQSNFACCSINTECCKNQGKFKILHKEFRSLPLPRLCDEICI